MFRLIALLEKNIREGNVAEAGNNIKSIVEEGYSCRISLAKKQTNPKEIPVNVFEADMLRPLKLIINCFLDDTFLDLKRKICGELSLSSPYQQKLFVCKGTSADIIYEFPMNKDKISDYLKSTEDFKLNPVCVFITEASPEIRVDSPTNDDLKWACSTCSFKNSHDIINCIVCGKMKE